MTRRMIATLCGLVAAFANPIAAASASAQQARPRVVLAVDGIGQTRNLPVLVAERLHYFTDAGLTVTLVEAPAEPSVEALVADGRADGAVAFYHHTFMTQTDLKLVTQAVVVMGASPQLKLVVAERLRDTVKTVADLKGRKIFVGGANSGKTTTMNWLALRAGMRNDDYAALTPTTPTAMMQALRDRSADAIIAHEPDVERYLASGAAYVLADVNSVDGTKKALGAPYPSTALYLPAAYIAAHPDEVQKLVNACVRALTYINSHSAAEIAAILPPKVVGSNNAAFVKMLADDKLAFATDGRLPIEAARQQLDVMTALSPKYKSVTFAQTYTNRFVERVPAR
ncbi:MAG: ABC transporter substrate-binding protein [Pseudomonadota bacterium]